MDYTKEAHIFRKKPVTIAAIQWTGINFEEVKAFFGKDAKEYAQLTEVTLDGEVKGTPKGNLSIESSKSRYTVSPDDFIIRDVKGEYYPCKPDIFEATYEVVN